MNHMLIILRTRRLSLIQMAKKKAKILLSLQQCSHLNTSWLEITNGNIFKKGAGPIENYYKNQLEEMTKIEVRHIMFMAKRCSVL